MYRCVTHLSMLHSVPSVPGWSKATRERRVDEMVAVVAGDAPIKVIVVTIAFI